VNVVLNLAVTSLLFAVPAFAVDSFFDIFMEGYTYGSSHQHDQGIGHMSGGGFHLDLNAHTSFSVTWGPNFPNTQAQSSNGLPPGEPGPASYFDAYLAGPDAPPPTINAFVQLEIDLLGGGPSHLVPLHDGDPDSFFDVVTVGNVCDVTYRVEVGPGGGCHELHSRFECMLPSAYAVSGFQVYHDPSTHDSIFTMGFFAARSTPTDQGYVLHLTTTGEFLPGTVATQPATWGRMKSLYRQ